LFQVPYLNTSKQYRNTGHTDVLYLNRLAEWKTLNTRVLYLFIKAYKV